jgi:hypothetical protein
MIYSGNMELFNINLGRKQVSVPVSYMDLPYITTLSSI